LKKVVLILAIVFFLTGCENVDYKNYSFDDITYDVPTSWDVKNVDDFIYYYPDEGYLMVHKSSVELGDNPTAEDIEMSFDGFESGSSSSLTDYKKIDSKSILVDSDISAREISFYSTVKNIYLETKTIVFPVGNTLFSVSFFQPDKISDNNLQIFKEIVDSIKISE